MSTSDDSHRTYLEPAAPVLEHDLGSAPGTSLNEKAASSKANCRKGTYALRRFLGVESTCQRMAPQVFNSRLGSNSETIRQLEALKAYLHLADRDESCCSAHDLLGDLRYRKQKVWREADALSPREVNRKAVT
eukprot:1161433-Pelagomonas_calceolata.AAC.6